MSDVLRTAADTAFVMTGATRGFGRVAALEILRGNPRVHLAIVARSGGELAARELAAESGNPHVTAYSADLASLPSLRRAVRAIVDDLESGALPPLSGIVGNAGQQLLSTTAATVDGIEVTFAVNVVAHHLLITGLSEHLIAPAQIVLTTSDTHFGDFAHNLAMVPAPEWRDPALLATPGTEPEADTAQAGRTAYSTSKLAVIYHVHALARSLPDGVKIASFNPGLVPGTGLVRDAGPVTRFAFRTIMPLLTVTPWARRRSVSGADLAAAALGRTLTATGDYVNGRRVERSSDESYHRAREEDLLAELVRLGG